MSSKQKLGQFFTTHSNYILQNFELPKNIEHIIEPFAGNKDLVKFIEEKNYTNQISLYDIDPKHNDIIKRDTLSYPPEFENSYIITNPPYLARNKNSNKELYNQYDTNDLYKCFIKILITNVCIGGIIIIPLNFLCSIRKGDINLRKQFLSVYEMVRVNIFEESIFDDTSYSICGIQFVRKTENIKPIILDIYPSKKQLEIVLNNYTIGGEMYELPQSNNYKIERATSKHIKNMECVTNIVLKCLDDNSKNKINLKIVDDVIRKKYIDTSSNGAARSYATLVITPKLSKEQEIELVDKFNRFLNEKRTKYNSLFLSNYRESKDIARKRISFKLAYEICSHLLIGN